MPVDEGGAGEGKGVREGAASGGAAEDAAAGAGPGDPAEAAGVAVCRVALSLGAGEQAARAAVAIRTGVRKRFLPLACRANGPAAAAVPALGEGSAERRGVVDPPRRALSVQHQPLEVFPWRSAISQHRIVFETEPTIIGGIAKHDAADGIDPPQALQAASDERRTDTASLPVRQHRERAEAVPAALPAVDLHRRKGDVADDFSIRCRGD